MARRTKPTRKSRRRARLRAYCTVCKHAYPAGRMTPKKYVEHVRKWHTKMRRN